MKRVLSELCYWEFPVPDNVMDTIGAEIYFEPPNESYNHRLAGNIENEYVLRYSREAIRDFIVGQAWAELGAPYELTDVWVNMQKAGEFNPPHSHGGDYSFVIFHTIPYRIEHEMAQFPVVNGGSVAGHFSFLYQDTVKGGVVSHMIPVDKNYEGFCFLFPASLKHAVYPFYTTTDHRITVAGNLVKEY